MRRSLLRQFALVLFVFSLATLQISGYATYRHQTRSHQAQQEQLLREIASYLTSCIQEDGADKAMYRRKREMKALR